MNFRLQSVAAWAVFLVVGVPLDAAAAEAKAAAEAAREAPKKAGAAKLDYILQPEDQLRVYVFKEEDINKGGEVTVSQEYTITLPLINAVDLRGLTARQAGEKIRAAYDKDYLVNPQVTVTVLKYVERSVNVLGSVKKAGKVVFPAEGSMTLMDAISGAEGYDRLANLKAVRLTRKNERGDAETMTIDATAIIESRRDDVPLQPGDQIVVPERIF